MRIAMAAGLALALVVGAVGCKGKGGGSTGTSSGSGLGSKSGKDEGAANFLVLKKQNGSDPSLGDRVKGRGLTVQAPKGSFDDVGQPGDDTSIYRAKGSPRWQIAITRDNQRSYSLSALQSMVTANVKDGKVVAPATEVTVNGVKAVKIEYERKVADQSLYAVLYALPVKEEGTTGMVYQVVYMSDPKEKDKLRPMFEKSIATMSLPD